MKAHFIGAKKITSKKNQQEYGLVSVAVMGSEGGMAQDLFCDPAVAMRAKAQFQFLQPVELLVEQSMGFRGLELRLTDVQAAAKA
jgi:hypothetical protein